MKKIRKGDPVIVISGKHKGKISSIGRVDGDFVYVKDVNVVKKAKKGEGFVDKHLPLHASSVSYYLESEKKPTRIRFEVSADGKKKSRVAVRTGKTI
ncbi:50S ribosomal protein L24 [candidate division SR1 bacterium]|nr:50S ribosomal protein L24 [candidate division SR1 bacterium]